MTNSKPQLKRFPIGIQMFSENIAVNHSHIDTTDQRDRLIDSGDVICLIGIAFDSEKKNMAGFEWERV
jgi:hypothetical protein